jgi:hypothetical protein
MNKPHTIFFFTSSFFFSATATPPSFQTISFHKEELFRESDNTSADKAMPALFEIYLPSFPNE